MRLSVVIPTFNRRERLIRTLAALETQVGDVPGGVEVVVVDDGSSDGTRELLAGKSGNGPLKALFPAHGGPAHARNEGARAATGEILVFLGDDVVPRPGFLAAHERAHRDAAAPPRAVLGRTEWDPGRMRVTPLLAHLDRRGLQFGYDLIRDREDVPAWFFYASNVSIPRRLFLSIGGFDESFGGAAWEDVEFAFRGRDGTEPLRIVYRPEAHALHDHPTTLSSFRARQRLSGRAAALLAAKRPDAASSLGVEEARTFPRHRPLLLTAIEILVRALDPLGVPMPGRLYDKLFRWDYLSGLAEALKGPAEEASKSSPSEAAGLHHSV